VPKTITQSLKAQIETKNILSICDGCKSDKWPTDITLIRHKNNIRFYVDLHHLKHNTITFSASLLELAIRIKGGNNE